MNKKTTFGTLLTLLALLVQSLVVPPAAAAFCDAAQFVADITVQDGENHKPGDTFDKTWRLKNVGTCTWTKDYKLVLASGDQMGISAPVPFPNQNVSPGQTVDLTIKNMVAPNISGTVRSYWQLQNANNFQFGIGIGADKAFWVQIKVSGSGGSTGPGYNFAEKVSEATWTNGTGARIDNPKLENGTSYSGAGLQMSPPAGTNTFIQAQYPAFRVQSGDRFQSLVNCEYQATTCWVNFRLDYQIGSGAVQTFWQFNEAYEGLYYTVDRDLSSLSGQDVKFILRVGSAGSASGDRALWAGPRIARSGASGPTITPTVTLTGTPPTPTRTPVPSNGKDRATFVADSSVPDGTVFGPNATFTKKWKIKNNGTSTWTTAYKLVFVSGAQLGAPNEIPLTSTINPNTTYEFIVEMKSPASNGHYVGFWQLKNAAGALFGIGPSADKPWWVDITVSGGSTGPTATPTPTKTLTPVITATPTRTLTPGTPGASSPTPTATKVQAGSCDRLSVIADVTIPDGQIFAPNVPFKKTWRLQNIGTCTWTTDYKLVFVSGAQMSGPSVVNLTSAVGPNTTVDVSVDLTSPASSGTHRGYWQLKNAAGGVFGFGTNADSPFWVEIRVQGGTITATITRTLTPSTLTTTATPATATPTATVTKTLEPGITPTATLQPSGSYAMVGVPEGYIVYVRSAAGQNNPLMGWLQYDQHNLTRLGAPAMVGADEWWQIQETDGDLAGWVYASFLTEYVTPTAFCADAKVTTLLNNLGTALKNSDGTALAALVSPRHGVEFRLVSNNDPVGYSQSTAASIFTSTTVQNWGPAAASGETVNGTFKDVMQPKLLDVYNSSFQLGCNDTSKVGPVSEPWPSELININFYSAYKPATGTNLDWRDFLVGVEYVNGQPYLLSLVHFEWVP